MRKKKWIKIPDNKIRDDTYEFLSVGTTAYIYINMSCNKLVKIIIGSQSKINEEFIIECKKEIDFQMRAANEDLAPTIYFHGLIKQEKSIFRDRDNNSIVPYYYIVMDYLSEKIGWKYIFPDDIPEHSLKYIYNLVKKTGLINIKDPDMHFYFNYKLQKLFMIDYGNCEECHLKNEDNTMNCISRMIKRLHINYKTFTTTTDFQKNKIKI